MALTNALMGSALAPLTAQSILGNPASVTAAGSSQGTATALSAGFNNVTAASGADGVVLPTTGSQLGDNFVVGNVGSTTVKVYPGGSDTANGSTSAVSVAQNKIATFWRISSTAWLYIVTA